MKVKKKVEKILTIIIILVIGLIYNEFFVEKNNNNNLNVNPTIKEDIKLKIDGNLNIYYLDVGQADSILIESADKYMLIDAGNTVDGNKLVAYFKELGITEFQYVIATHAHEDHIGGMDDIINNFKIHNFYMPDVISTSKTFEDMLIAMEENSLAYESPKIGSKFMLGSMDFEVLHVGVEGDELNDTSIVVKGNYGETNFLFMGDATENVEKKLLNKNLKSDVIKVGHHGSRYSSTLSFLNKVQPKYAIISVGIGNSYNHPHKQSLNRFEKLGIKVYRTDKDGTIVVSSDGKNISINTVKTNLNG